MLPHTYADIKRMLAIQLPLESDNYSVYDTITNTKVNHRLSYTELKGDRYEIDIPIEAEDKINAWLRTLDDNSITWAPTATYWVLSDDRRLGLTLMEQIGRLTCIYTEESLRKLCNDVKCIKYLIG